MWGQKAPPKHENGGQKTLPKPQSGGRKRPRTEVVQIRAEKVWGQKVPPKCKSGGKKRHHSDKREKSHGGGMCHQNGKVVAENATKTAK